MKIDTFWRFAFNKKKKLHGYINDVEIFGIIRCCQGFKLRIWNPLTG